MEKSISKLLGSIGEVLAYQKLVEEGFRVCRWAHYRSLFAEWGDPYQQKIPIAFCGHLKCKYGRKESAEICENFGNCIEVDGHYRATFGRWELEIDDCPCMNVFPKICNVLCPEKCMTSKLFSLMKSLVDQDMFIAPDFIAHKDGRHHLVEVKTNKGLLEPKQEVFLVKSKELEFVPLLIKVDVKLHSGIEITEI